MPLLSYYTILKINNSNYTNEPRSWINEQTKIIMCHTQTVHLANKEKLLTQFCKYSQNLNNPIVSIAFQIFYFYTPKHLPCYEKHVYHNQPVVYAMNSLPDTL